MIIPIEINTQDILNQFNISQSQIESMLDNIAKNLAVVYVSKLETEASSKLNSTRDRYLRAIRVIDSGKLESTVLLDYSKDPLVKMIEEGASPFDMKQGILNGPKSKVSAKGVRYNTIPMRWATPGAVGESSSFSGKMPQEIYDAVRTKPTTIPVRGGGGRSQGLSASQIPAAFQAPSTRGTIVDSNGSPLFREYQHKTSIYEGIVKKTDSSTGQSSYFSFRRVSENSDANAFIHPGIVAHKLMNIAYSSMNLDEEVGLQIDNELIKLGY